MNSSATDDIQIGIATEKSRKHDPYLRDWGADVVSDFSSANESRGDLLGTIEEAKNPRHHRTKRSHHIMRTPLRIKTDKDYQR